MSSFTKSPPLVAQPPDYKLYKVQVDFRYYVGEVGSSEIVEVKAGTITDGASIPQWAWSIIGGPLGPYAPAAVVHDQLYVRGTYSRKYSDWVFVDAMRVLDVPWWRRRTMWFAVRVAGWKPWNKYRKQDVSGLS